MAQANDPVGVMPVMHFPGAISRSVRSPPFMPKRLADLVWMQLGPPSDNSSQDYGFDLSYSSSQSDWTKRQPLHSHPHRSELQAPADPAWFPPMTPSLPSLSKEYEGDEDEGVEGDEEETETEETEEVENSLNKIGFRSQLQAPESLPRSQLSYFGPMSPTLPSVPQNAHHKLPLFGLKFTGTIPSRYNDETKQHKNEEGKINAEGEETKTDSTKVEDKGESNENEAPHLSRYGSLTQSQRVKQKRAHFFAFDNEDTGHEGGDEAVLDARPHIRSRVRVPEGVHNTTSILHHLSTLSATEAKADDTTGSEESVETKTEGIEGDEENGEEQDQERGDDGPKHLLRSPQSGRSTPHIYRSIVQAPEGLVQGRKRANSESSYFALPPSLLSSKKDEDDDYSDFNRLSVRVPPSDLDEKPAEQPASVQGVNSRFECPACMHSTESFFGPMSPSLPAVNKKELDEKMSRLARFHGAHEYLKRAREMEHNVGHRSRLQAPEIPRRRHSDASFFGPLPSTLEILGHRSPAQAPEGIPTYFGPMSPTLPLLDAHSSSEKKKEHKQYSGLNFRSHLQAPEDAKARRWSISYLEPMPSAPLQTTSSLSSLESSLTNQEIQRRDHRRAKSETIEYQDEDEELHPRSRSLPGTPKTSNVHRRRRRRRGEAESVREPHPKRVAKHASNAKHVSNAKHASNAMFKQYSEASFFGPLKIDESTSGGQQSDVQSSDSDNSNPSSSRRMCSTPLPPFPRLSRMSSNRGHQSFTPPPPVTRLSRMRSGAARSAHSATPDSRHSRTSSGAVSRTDNSLTQSSSFKPQFSPRTVIVKDCSCGSLSRTNERHAQITPVLSPQHIMRSTSPFARETEERRCREPKSASEPNSPAVSPKTVEVESPLRIADFSPSRSRSQRPRANSVPDIRSLQHHATVFPPGLPTPRCGTPEQNSRSVLHFLQTPSPMHRETPRAQRIERWKHECRSVDSRPTRFEPSTTTTVRVSSPLRRTMGNEASPQAPPPALL